MLGRDMAMMSVTGLVAASGVVVNASLVLVHYVNQRREEGVELEQAVHESAVTRFRPIFLTSAANGTAIACASTKEGRMSLVRLLGFSKLPCGCVVGQYREVATCREVTYVEEKGPSCGAHAHRRNHTLNTSRQARVPAGYQRLRAS